ncbi:RimJ/RimL family protein N-acetyltransferase [Roseibium marinum]|uniref:RimJ/RimL family protein N-acetyltransferase n=2 Tax=Roseibium marinum TaxID=281252 RepID=A0A2S3ULS5_9HYPH|nr:RimJ/RimL family protein N-acetyltransferase [Roseibium marinum]
MSEVEVCRRLNDYIGDHKRLGISKWKLETLEGEFAGRAGFSRLDDPDGFELSYSLKRKAWGNGYATEIACGLVAWFFRKTSEPYLMAYAVSEHGASQRVMIKAGLFYWYEMKKYGVPCRFYRIERKDFERFSSAGAKPADELVH